MKELLERTKAEMREGRRARIRCSLELTPMELERELTRTAGGLKVLVEHIKSTDRIVVLVHTKDGYVPFDEAVEDFPSQTFLTQLMLIAPGDKS